MCHFTVVSHVKIIQFCPYICFYFQFSSNFYKNEAILSILKLILNLLLFYKSYGDILTKINVFIKYF